MQDNMTEYDRQHKCEEAVELEYARMRANYRLSKDTMHIVHGYMEYECKDCKRRFKIYLEQGLEDEVYDALHGGHKPVPFNIVCPYCVREMVRKVEENIFDYRKDVKGLHCIHVNWGVGDNMSYTPLPKNASFFWNDEDTAEGIPVHPIIEKEIEHDIEHEEKDSSSIPKHHPFSAFIYGNIKGRMVGTRKSRRIVGKKR